MSVIDGNDVFKKKFVSLLISQRDRVLVGGKGPEKKGFKSVGEILGSGAFINYSNKKYENGKQLFQES